MANTRLCLGLIGLLATGSCPAETPPGPEMIEVRAFFTRGDEPYPVSRFIPATDAVVHASLALLLAGPTEREREDGVHSWFDQRTAGALRSFTLDADGDLRIDFHDFRQLIPGASSSAGSEMLLGEIHATLFQHDIVATVEIGIEGSCETFWHFLQRPCYRLHRDGPP